MTLTLKRIVRFSDHDSNRVHSDTCFDEITADSPETAKERVREIIRRDVTQYAIYTLSCTLSEVVK